MINYRKDNVNIFLNDLQSKQTHGDQEKCTSLLVKPLKIDLNNLNKIYSGKVHVKEQVLSLIFGSMGWRLDLVEVSNLDGVLKCEMLTSNDFNDEICKQNMCLNEVLRTFAKEIHEFIDTDSVRKKLLVGTKSINVGFSTSFPIENIAIDRAYVTSWARGCYFYNSDQYDLGKTLNQHLKALKNSQVILDYNILILLNAIQYKQSSKKCSNNAKNNH